MAAAQFESLAKADLWPEYRSAFAEFSQRLRRVQSLAAHLNADPEALLTASLEVEEARLLYNFRRDALVRQFLSPQPPDSVS